MTKLALPIIFNIKGDVAKESSLISQNPKGGAKGPQRIKKGVAVLRGTGTPEVEPIHCGTFAGREGRG